ncbi:hypothetical protein [Carboxylicivirga marina]|uniref:Initiator Rep protein domain-containing protein n=1 Tax=Carboxylicivirga marina TaxID=2800988 RepID=A0ABS1HQV3_9BACT|nr:hypothetical protein [Carboxylicivirga marina]MBK3519544.1 hypothetical protein [Carboxylicivirga marina]
MAKSKSRKKKSTPPNGGYKKFISDMMNFMNTFQKNTQPPFDTAEKRRIYDTRLQLRRPDAADKLISVKELDIIFAYIKEMHRKPKIKITGRNISTYQILLFYSYNRGIERRCEKELGKGHIECAALTQSGEELYKIFLQHYLVDIFAIITRMSNPTYKFYGITFRTASFIKDDLRFELVSKVSATPAQKKHINFNGHYRPAYRLGKATATESFEWIQFLNKDLPETIRTSHQTYSLYMQAHAISRLKERLDLLDKESVNYTIWENTASTTNFINHKHYTLLPVNVHQIRIGYFVVEPIDDMLIIKTFLFITHSCTPEGDKLKEITGLGKSDISYWKIDRLSTFVNLDEEKHPKLMQLFTDAGMQDLALLKDKDFDIESIQTANLDKLKEYLETSHNYKEAKEEDVVIHA